jgi:hypothetical protein
MLVLKAHIGLGEDSDLRQAADRPARKAESSTNRRVWFY